MAVRKTVLITGATGGIGTAFACAYVRCKYAQHLNVQKNPMFTMAINPIYA